MTRQDVATIIESFNKEGVRYLIAGGFAVVAYGFVRLTVDLDVILEMSVENQQKALSILGQMGYRPRAPVPVEGFLDPELRQVWIEEKGMLVFSMTSSLHPLTEVDIFLHMPFEPEEAFARGVTLEILPGVPAKFVSLDHLVTMKRNAGRPKDEEDLRKLSVLYDIPEKGRTEDE